MKRFFLIGILCLAAVGQAAADSYSLTAKKATVKDVTVDKDNYFVVVEAATSTGEYEVAFDIWPAKHSAFGSFSAENKTITYVSCYVHKVSANGSAVDMWYYPDEGDPITLAIEFNGDGTSTLSGEITARRKGVAYTYVIAPFTFAYTEEEVVPDPEVDPYRYEPKDPTAIDFKADVIELRQKEGYVEITLNEMANETYDWIELRLLSDTLLWPAGTYDIHDGGALGTLTVSKGYLDAHKADDPCYVAIREDKENWGQYTPYYLVSGALKVSYNTEKDTITVTGEAMSHNGSTVKIYARGYNMLYVQPVKPEKVALTIDTVQITYRSDLSDSIKNEFYYNFNFFTTSGDYPTVLVDLVFNKPMALTAGTYTLAADQLKGLYLFQNQADFNNAIFSGINYDFATASLKLTEAQNGKWTYDMFMTTDIGSEYSFAFSQNPRIVLYPEPTDSQAEKDKPYADEQKEKATVTVALDSILWKAETVTKDGIIDIYMTQRNTDVNGLRAYMHLGMYADAEYPAAGTYPVNATEETGTFSASPGRFDNVLIPCYLLLVDNDGWAHAVWYMVGGSVTLGYDEQQRPVLSGDCTTYFGSTVKFSYTPGEQGIDHVRRGGTQSAKILRNGQLYLLFEGAMYDVHGRKIENQ